MKELIALHQVELGIVNGKPVVHKPKAKFKAPDQKTEDYLLRVRAAREFSNEKDGPSKAEAEEAIRQARIKQEDEDRIATENRKQTDATLTNGGDPLAGKTRAEMEAFAEENELTVDGANMNKGEYGDAVRAALTAKQNADTGEGLI